MDGASLLVTALLVLLAAVGGFWLGRRSLRARVGDLQRETSRAEDALAREEQAAREDRRVQDLVLGSMQEGILLLDAAGETAFANEALTRHLGGHPDRLANLFPVTLRDLAADVAAGGTPDAATVEIERDLPARWIRVTATAAGDDGSVLLVVSDVTASRRLEAVRRDFVANASHELKTPAASIRAAAETLRSMVGDDPEAARRFAERLETEAMRLSRIVADLLDLSRLESGEGDREPLRLDLLVREETERFDLPAGEAGIALQVRVEEPIETMGSGRDLALLVRNLVDNAVRATARGGSVKVELGRAAGAADGGGETRAVLTVRDSGAGIPARDLPRVFERFFRVDRARSRETGGTGLGLAIVKHVAESHGGTVRVESGLGEGSTFTVELPGASAVPATRAATTE